MAVPSPCTQVCTLDAVTGRCLGCLRTIEEIAAWATLDDGARLAVWAELDLRREAMPPHTTPQATA